MEQTFQDAYLGFSTVLIKADKTDPSIVYLEASNEGLDSDEEVIVVEALKSRADTFMKSGVLSYDHLHKIEKDPKYIIGEPLDVKFTDDNRTLVKGRLYKEMDLAKSIMQMMASKTTRLGASVGGSVMTKSKQYSAKAKKMVPVISRLGKWDEVAITYKPVNQETLGKCSYMKFAEFAKALTVSSGVDAGSFTGGRALIPESLQGKTTQKFIFKNIVSGVYTGDIASYKDLRKYLDSVGLKKDKEAMYIAQIVVSKLDQIKNAIQKI